MLRPLVFILSPTGNSISDIFDNIYDFPLFPFPTTPILIELSSVESKYLAPFLLFRTCQPITNPFIEFISTIIS